MNQHQRARFSWLLFAVLLYVSVGQASGSSENKAPNILLILIDDMGWPALSSYGNRHVQTIHMDRLASEGMRFTSAYVMPQCTPTRAALLTGRNNASNGMWHVIPRYYYPFARIQEPPFVENLPRGTFTIAKALQDRGYKTALLGKWHLTHNEDGYYTYLKDEAKQFYGFDYVNPITDPTEYQSYGDKGVDFLTDETIRFMEQNQDQPFFIYLSHHTIHGPVLAPEKVVQQYQQLGYSKEGIHNATYLAALEHLDQSIGRLLQNLDQRGKAGDTIVFFLSDNGGVDELFDNHPLRAGKGSIYEGGIRVPLIIRWPGRVRPGTVSDEPVHVTDLFPTILEIAGQELEKFDHSVDGSSLLPLLMEEKGFKTSSLCWFTPLYDKRWGLTPSAAIRRGRYKLIHFFGDYVDLDDGRKYIPEGRIELYDLQKDLGERRDLSGTLPELKEELLGELHDWIQSTGNEIPGINPKFDRERWFEEAR
jgi:uncharacterized sulfatase